MYLSKTTGDSTVSIPVTNDTEISLVMYLLKRNTDHPRLANEKMRSRLWIAIGSLNRKAGKA